MSENRNDSARLATSLIHEVPPDEIDAQAIVAPGVEVLFDIESDAMKHVVGVENLVAVDKDRRNCVDPLHACACSCVRPCVRL